jgi:RNA polymerase sigma-70 factor (ECF subfamily)
VARAITAEEFESLYTYTVRDVLTYVRRRASVDAEDLVSEVYVVAWRRRTDLPAPALRRAWLFGVARRLLQAEVRHRQREGQLVSDLAARPEPAADTTANDRTGTVVATALERLSPNDREILRLVSWECLTPAELAVALGVRPGAARVRLHRARKAFASDPDIRSLVGEADQSAHTLTR